MQLLQLFTGSKSSDMDKEEEIRSLNERLSSLSLQLTEKESHIEKLVSILESSFIS